jgi:hypothetical protein
LSRARQHAARSRVGRGCVPSPRVGGAFPTPRRPHKPPTGGTRAALPHATRPAVAHTPAPAAGAPATPCCGGGGAARARTQGAGAAPPQTGCARAGGRGVVPTPWLHRATSTHAGTAWAWVLLLVALTKRGPHPAPSQGKGTALPAPVAPTYTHRFLQLLCRQRAQVPLDGAQLCRVHPHLLLLAFYKERALYCLHTTVVAAAQTAPEAHGECGWGVGGGGGGHAQDTGRSSSMRRKRAHTSAPTHTQ